MRCPYCGSVVEPTRDTSGALFCPACQNTGKVKPAWPPQPNVAATPQGGPAAAPGRGGRPREPPGKAIAALVLGIASLVVFPLGIILGPLALVFGIKAMGELKRSPPGRSGQGMAITGMVLGGIGILFGVYIVMAAVVFVLVSNLGEGPGSQAPSLSFVKDESGPGGTLTVVVADANVQWWEFYSSGTAGCTLPFGEVRAGDVIECPSAGSFELVHDPTGELLYSTTFLD